MTPAPRSLRSARIAAVLVVLLMLASAYHFGLLARVDEPKALADALVAMGPLGYLVFVLAYAVLQPFGVPGTVFIVAAPLIWPWPTAFALSMVGTMAASVVGFAFARFVARDWVASRIPSRLRKYEASLERSAFRMVVLLRLMLWMPQPLHWFFGVSRVGFWTHFWGSIIGYAPPLLVVSYLGAELFDASGNLQPGAWPIMAGLLAASISIALLAHLAERRRSSSRARDSASDPTSSSRFTNPQRSNP
ncbi:TVP38/TMEM64 family protein [Hyalangium rubrum]|uniref:TVP38/TMEM64 family membrane protein n=1 Tax=Hyalangium rubrum TaxID=3103134 RepID=A0ABU5GWY9_9BACT|nr:VTT domain-containing protein [Hyalangium sp. s54d21]MDY7225708.1 VTT domain-containing protein [Hyalangium sp. s54d21]